MTRPAALLSFAILFANSVILPAQTGSVPVSTPIKTPLKTGSVPVFAPFLTAIAPEQTSLLAARDRMVIVISLDGFPAYDLEDPKLPIPTLRQLMKNGSWATRMQPVNPTVTWPNHTTLVTGVHPADHGLLYNGSLIRTDNPLAVKVDPNIDKTKMVHVATLYDLAHDHGLTTAQVDWVAINNAPTITWAFPERAKPADPLVAEMISKHLLSAEDIGNSDHPTIVWRDQIWTRAGAYLIRDHKPNLLLFHLLSLDSTHHNYAPRTLASYDAIAFLDNCVRQLVDAVHAAGMSDRATFIIVSDHGFKSVSKQIHLLSLLATSGFGNAVRAVPEGGSAMIYVDQARRAELLPKLEQVFSQTEGVQSVAKESQFRALGLPVPAADPQAPDLIAYAKSGYAFAGGKEGDSVIAALPSPTGSHGYINTDPEMDAIFIASGYGIRPGVQLEKIPNLRVAPTLAKLLGISLPKADAQPLTEILK